MLSRYEDAEIRMAIFEWLDLRNDDWVTWDELVNGFSFRGETLRLVSPAQGIWRPANKFPMRGVLSVMSDPNGPYDDLALGNDQIMYKYMGSNPDHAANRYLRQSFDEQIPFIFLKKIRDGIYLPLYEAYVEDSFPQSLEVLINISGSPLSKGTDQYVPEEIARRYEMRNVKQRVHQPKFRTQVLFAYEEKCAICRLNHPGLLDAAHIVPDHHEKGLATISNGISLCKIHHAAYDREFIGISPDLSVHVKENLMREKDGPMLQHGIQEMHGVQISVPRLEEQRPDKELLDFRFKKFLEKA